MSHCITQAKSAVGCFVKNKPQSNRLVTKSRPLILMDCFLSVLTSLHTESDRVCQHVCVSKSWCRSKLPGISFLPVTFPSRSATHCQRSARKWHGDAGMRSLYLYIKFEAQRIWPAPLCVSIAKAGKETGEGGRLVSMWIEACVSVASQWGERLTDDGGADARQTMA